MPRFFEQSSAVLYKTCLSQDRSASATWFIHWIQDLTWSNYHFFLPTKRSTQISNGMHPRAMTLSYQPGSLWTCQDYLPRSILVNKHVLVYFVSLRTEALFLVVLFLWAFRKRLSFWDQGPAALTRLVAGLSDRRRDACCTREKEMEFTDGFGSSGNFREDELCPYCCWTSCRCLVSGGNCAKAVMLCAYHYYALYALRVIIWNRLDDQLSVCTCLYLTMFEFGKATWI